jgi:uncharacterized protein (TIGR04255 family)
MELRRSYLNPPIVKARCAIFFDLDSVVWTSSSLVALHEQFKDDYDGIARIEPMGYTTRTPTEASSLNEPAEEQKAVFPTADLSRAIIATPSALTVQVSSPYEGWESFSLRISKAITGWVAAVGDREVTGISVSYDNEIVLPVPVSGLNDYFNVRVNPMADTTTRVWKALHSFTVTVEDNLIVDVNLSSYNDKSQDNSTSYLNINATTLQTQGDRVSKCFSQIENAKKQVTWMFENIITDNARQNFVEL